MLPVRTTQRNVGSPPDAVDVRGCRDRPVWGQDRKLGMSRMSFRSAPIADTQEGSVELPASTRSRPSSSAPGISLNAPKATPGTARADRLVAWNLSRRESVIGFGIVAWQKSPRVDRRSAMRRSEALAPVRQEPRSGRDLIRAAMRERVIRRQIVRAMPTPGKPVPA